MGTILLSVGMGLVVVARIQLGRSFSIMPTATKLMTKGLYSKIRNPIYVFSSTMIVGLILVIQRPILWFGFAMVAVIQTVRARRESRVLEAAFGDEYREYRSKTWF